jgi:hypothetical protein
VAIDKPSHFVFVGRTQEWIRFGIRIGNLQTAVTCFRTIKRRKAIPRGDVLCSELLFIVTDCKAGTPPMLLLLSMKEKKLAHGSLQPPIIHTQHFSRTPTHTASLAKVQENISESCILLTIVL